MLLILSVALHRRYRLSRQIMQTHLYSFVYDSNSYIVWVPDPQQVEGLAPRLPRRGCSKLYMSNYADSPLLTAMLIQTASTIGLSSYSSFTAARGHRVYVRRASSSIVLLKLATFTVYFLSRQVLFMIAGMELGGDEFSDWILQLGDHIHDKRLKAVFSKVKLCLSKTIVGIYNMSRVDII